jgi:hypothetical protein
LKTGVIDFRANAFGCGADIRSIFYWKKPAVFWEIEIAKFVRLNPTLGCAMLR